MELMMQTAGQTHQEICSSLSEGMPFGEVHVAQIFAKLDHGIGTMNASGCVLRRHKDERWLLSGVCGQAPRNRLLAPSALDSRARYNALRAVISHLVGSESRNEIKS
jgi:hypothetical protein